LPGTGASSCTCRAASTWPRLPKTSSAERSAAWRARVASANALKRAEAEAQLEATLGQEAYALLLVKRQKCRARVALHRSLARGA
jgi:hypothetical protein